MSRLHELLVDDIDTDLLSAANWHINPDGYAHARYQGKPTFLHRIILARKIKHELAHHEQTDHINGNRLDNRRDNLRVASVADNAHNMKLHSRNTSGYKGVSWNRRDNVWQAHIRVNYIKKNLGWFTSKEEAARAYDRAARVYFGKFANLNFPEENGQPNEY